MGKLIAVSGPPASGKTTVAVNLAQEVYAATKQRVIYFSPDKLIPALGVLFPTRDREKMYSIGSALENVNLAITDILAVLATTKDMDNFGYLGYKSGDGPFSYPDLSENKVITLLTLLKENCDYLFVDCDRDRNDLVSLLARGIADEVIYLINPDVKSFLYYATEIKPEHFIQVMNLTSNDVFLPIGDAKSHFGQIPYTLMYSKAVKEQMMEGTLTKYVKDNVYRTAMKDIAKELIRVEAPQAQEAEVEPDVQEDENPLTDNQVDELWS